MKDDENKIKTAPEVNLCCVAKQQRGYSYGLSQLSLAGLRFRNPEPVFDDSQQYNACSAHKESNIREPRVSKFPVDSASGNAALTVFQHYPLETSATFSQVRVTLCHSLSPNLLLNNQINAVCAACVNLTLEAELLNS